MIDIGTAILGGVFYFAGHYGLALGVMVLAIVSGIVTAAIAVASPAWYVRKKLSAGLEADLFNPRKGIVPLLITKIIIVAVLTLAAWHIVQKAGYL